MEKYKYKKTQNDFNHIAEILFDIYLFQGIQPSRVITRSDKASCIQNFWKYPRYPDPPDLFQYMFLSIYMFLSSSYARSITGQVTSVTWPVIDCA